jgi:hypothetical protein
MPDRNIVGGKSGKDTRYPDRRDTWHAEMIGQYTPRHSQGAVPEQEACLRPIHIAILMAK